MSSTVIPAEIVMILRSALLTELGEPAAKLEQASLHAGKEINPQWFSEPLGDLDRLRAALDAIGWNQPEHQQPISLDLDTHRWATVKALRTQLEVEHDYLQRGEEDGLQDQYELAAAWARLIEEFTATHGLTDDA